MTLDLTPSYVYTRQSTFGANQPRMRKRRIGKSLHGAPSPWVRQSQRPKDAEEAESKIHIDHGVEIAGMDEPEYDKDYPNKAIFEIDENKITGKGIPKELYFGLVVQHEGDIQAELTTNIRDTTALPWSKDDLIILQPGKTFGNMPATLSEIFEQWTDDDWTALVPYMEERDNVKQGRT